MILKKPFDINDKMLKYQTYKLSQLQQEYLELHEEFKALYPQEISIPKWKMEDSMIYTLQQLEN